LLPFRRAGGCLIIVWKFVFPVYDGDSLPPVNERGCANEDSLNQVWPFQETPEPKSHDEESETNIWNLDFGGIEG
jgi:hypothetical protein